MLLYCLLSYLNYIFSILFFLSPCSLYCCCRVCRFLYHFLCTGVYVIIYTIAFNYLDPEDLKFLDEVNARDMFSFIYMCWMIHFLLGILILPSKNFVPCLFSPIVYGFVKILRLAVNRICPEKWRGDAYQILDGMLSVEDQEEDAIKGVVEGKEDTKEIEGRENKEEIEGRKEIDVKGNKEELEGKEDTEEIEEKPVTQGQYVLCPAWYDCDCFVA